MADVAHALMESPQWERSALFIVYDEWGGFFDHVRPPRVPDQRNNRDVAKDFGLMGVRIPALTISPYARRGHVSHSIYGFESILKLLGYRFGVKPLNKRVAYANNIGRSFDWVSKPKLDLPSLPTPPDVVSQPCRGNPDGEATRANDHDLMNLVSTGYLDRLGFDFRRARPEDAFRGPSALQQAFRPPGT